MITGINFSKTRIRKGRKKKTIYYNRALMNLSEFCISNINKRLIKSMRKIRKSKRNKNKNNHHNNNNNSSSLLEIYSIHKKIIKIIITAII